MVEGKNIYWVSAAFCTGALCASFLATGLPSAITAVICINLLGICLALAGFLMGSGHMHQTFIYRCVRSIPFWACVFCLSGILCHCTGNIVAPGIDKPQIFPLLNARLRSITDSIPFADKENNALVKAIILGDRSGLSNCTKTAFRNAGAAHLLALSGMHLGFIYLFINKSLVLLGNSPLQRRIRSLVTIVLTGFYCLVCGAGASLTRAWIFITLSELSKLSGRSRDSGRIFCAALLLHLVFRSDCIRDLGFQLSYLAMAGIVFVWPHVRKWYRILEDSLTKSSSTVAAKRYIAGQRIWDILSMSICCQLFTAPLTWFHFGTFPTYFMITNLLASPLMSIVMFCGITAIGICALSPSTNGESYIVKTCEAPATQLRTLLQTISEL